MSKEQVFHALKNIIPDRNLYDVVMFCESHSKILGLFNRSTFVIEPHATYYVVSKSKNSLDFVIANK